ncbi:NYN domain-containing protein [Hoeflea marina]|uniref:NYN domain-containing protein n=1 Tax=Hoeflea marina TaxID=274592 RepID=A0A317PM36_9HYPH|nr:NYN domain-containing protein [Hoeflea marina]
MPAEYRVHIFVDFWNFTLSMKECEAAFKTDWRTFPKILTREAGRVVDATALAIYSGMNVYGSYNPATDGALKHWATNTLDTFPGVNALFKERTRKRSAPKCPACHAAVEKCPHCGSDMRGTEEKGIDTRIATDLVSLAWEKAYDIAVLVSADQDFVPAAEYLQNKGIKVIHGGFPPHGMLLRQKCWATIDLPRYRLEFRM